MSPEGGLTPRRVRALALLFAIAVLGGSTACAVAAEDPRVVLGRKIFFDRSLSASGELACASCHDPAAGYGPPNGLAVQWGGRNHDRQGMRAVPTLRYVLNRTPAWTHVTVANPAERMVEGNEPPSGGFGWDGRFDSLQDQAVFPFLDPNEMANAGPAAIAEALARADYAGEFRALFGAGVFADPERAFAQARVALERFLLEDPSFHPYTSKYDAFLDGKARLTRAERHGLALFEDPARGNCAACHPDRKGADGSHPLFTDYEFEALGVPRNPEIRANAAGDYFDLGLCGPLRKDQAGEAAYCGLFKTPTLRNVATRAVFFHNGRFHSLKDALRFYVRRDTDPQLWYPTAPSGEVIKFDDLPPALRANVDVIDEPLTRNRGAAPVWSDADLDDVISFLETLTDRDLKARPRTGRSPPTAPAS